MKRPTLLLIATLIVTVSCQPAPTPTVVPPTSTSVVAPPTPTSAPLTGIAVVIKGYWDAHSARNLDAAMAFFADDAVYTNHFGAKSVGKTEIRNLVQSEIGNGW
jgi:hypothetical protein